MTTRIRATLLPEAIRSARPALAVAAPLGSSLTHAALDHPAPLLHVAVRERGVLVGVDPDADLHGRQVEIPGLAGEAGLASNARAVLGVEVHRDGRDLGEQVEVRRERGD